MSLSMSLSAPRLSRDTMPSALWVCGATALAAAIAWGAWRARSLSASGAAAATIVGTVAMSAGAAWGAFLVLWFVVSSLLTRAGRAAKTRRTDGVVAKGGTRDAWQVLANGGVFAVCAAIALLDPYHADAMAAAIAAAGALAAAGADTAATEIGTRFGGRPWSLRTGRPAAIGMSGAISLPGTLAMIGAASAFAALAVVLTLMPRGAFWPVTAAATAGALVDTLVGAWWQARRWCPHCAHETEQREHRCGTPTVARGGVPWLSNDIVNVVCTVIGATVALLLA